MKIGFILILLLITQLLNAQNFTMLQQKCFGGSNNDIRSFGMLVNNSLYFMGITNSQNSGDVTDSLCDDNNPVTGFIGDLWYLKTDLNLNLIHQRTIGGTNIEWPNIFLNSNHSNKQYFFSHSNSDSSCNKTASLIGSDDIWMIEMDTIGQIVSDQNYGGIASEWSSNGIEFPDSSMIILTSSQMGGGGNQTAIGYGGWDQWAFKLDKNKNVVWNKVYGGSSDEFNANLFSSLLLKCSDSTFAFACASSSNISGNITQPKSNQINVNSDIWFVYCDTSGAIIFQKRFGGGVGEYPFSMIRTSDNGFLILSVTDSQVGLDVTIPPIGTQQNIQNIWLLKLDSLGNKQWDNRHGGSLYGDWPRWIEEAPDGGYWIACRITGSTPNCNISEPGYGFDDIWMLKVDSVGNKIWDKRFGSAGHDDVINFIILPDSSIIICATGDAGISGNKTDAGHGGWDYWAVHFKYTDTTSTVGFMDPIAFDESISLYPNPASDVVTIASNKTQIQNITMYNLLGELIETKNYTSSHNIQFDLQTYPKGVYIAKITGQNNTVARKVVKN